MCAIAGTTCAVCGAVNGGPSPDCVLCGASLSHPPPEPEDTGELYGAHAVVLRFADYLKRKKGER